MSSDKPGDQWTQPGDPTRPLSQSPPSPQSPAPSGPSGYGTPSSPSYGKYGQGTALPTPPPAPPTGPPQPQWGPPPGQNGPPQNGQWGQNGQPQWGQPGYQPQQQWQPSGPTELRPVGNLRPAVIALSVLLAVALVAGPAVAPNQHQVFVDAMNGVTTGTVTEPGSTGYSLVSSLGLLVEVAVWVLACLWLTRVRQNAMVLRPHRPRLSDAWIWLSWVVPVVNLWFPKQIVDDVLGATAAATGKPRLRTGLWWTFWLASLVCGIALAATTLLPPNDGVHAGLVAVDAVVTVVALLLWIRIVHQLSATQDALVGRPAQK